MSKREYSRKTPLTRSENINAALLRLSGPYSIGWTLENTIKKARSGHHAPKLRYPTLRSLLEAVRYLASAMIQQGMDPKYRCFTPEFNVNGNCVWKRKDTSENLEKLIQQIDELI